jgi:hypothetical protein
VGARGRGGRAPVGAAASSVAIVCSVVAAFGDAGSAAAAAPPPPKSTSIPAPPPTEAGAAASPPPKPRSIAGCWGAAAFVALNLLIIANGSSAIVMEAGVQKEKGALRCEAFRGTALRESHFAMFQVLRRELDSWLHTCAGRLDGAEA